MCFNVCIYLSRFNRFEDLALYLTPSLILSYLNLHNTNLSLFFVSHSFYSVFYSTPPHPPNCIVSLLRMSESVFYLCVEFVQAVPASNSITANCHLHPSIPPSLPTTIYFKLYSSFFYFWTTSPTHNSPHTTALHHTPLQTLCRNNDSAPHLPSHNLLFTTFEKVFGRHPTLPNPCPSILIFLGRQRFNSIQFTHSNRFPIFYFTISYEVFYRFLAANC